MFWLLVAAPWLTAAAPSGYQQCTQLAQSDAAAALRLAEKQLQEAPQPSAYHCRAMALFALGRYQQAAGALEQLSQNMTSQNPVLWGNVVRQAARSWRLAGDKAKAIVTLSHAISQTSEQALSDPLLSRLSAELLLDRSQLYLAGGRELFALQDLDQAISLSPGNPALLLARAKLFAKQGEVALARRDINALTTLNANYPGAAALKAQLGQ